MVRARWRAIQKAFLKNLPGAGFHAEDLVTTPLSRTAKDESREPASLGIPRLLAFFVGARSALSPQPSHGHMWFSPVIPMSGEEVLKAHKVFSDAFREWGAAPLYRTLPQSYHLRMIRLAAEHGWAEYRTAPAYMDACADVLSFNNHALRRLHETLKDAMDPNGILSAGRYGIWPSGSPQRAARRGE